MPGCLNSLFVPGEILKSLVKLAPCGLVSLWRGADSDVAGVVSRELGQRSCRDPPKDSLCWSFIGILSRGLVRDLSFKRSCRGKS